MRSPVRVYNSTTGQLVSEFAPAEDEGWTGASFSPDSTQVVSWGHLGKVLHLWDAATGKELHRLEGHTEACSGTFSPDGKRIVSGSADKTLRIWDAATGKELLKLEGHTDPCQGTFSPDGKLVFSFSGDKTIARGMRGPARRFGSKKAKLMPAFPSSLTKVSFRRTARRSCRWTAKAASACGKQPPARRWRTESQRRHAESALPARRPATRFLGQGQ